MFADIEGLERPWLSAKAVAAVIGTRTRAIMNMTYGGHPGASAALAELAAERGLILLEDAAHGLGGSLGGRRLGTFGLAGAYSFFSNKNLPVGEGGMVVTDDDEIASRVRLLRSHGMTSLTWDRHRGHASSYDVVDLGFNYRIDEPRAAMALQRLSRLDTDNARRATAAAAYRRRLERCSGRIDDNAGGRGCDPSEPPLHRRAREEIDRDALRATLAEQGVQTSLHYPPVHRFTAYGVDADLPKTEEYARRSVTLPMFPTISEEQIEWVADSLERAAAFVRD